MPQPTFRPRSWTDAGHSPSTTSQLRKSASIYDLTLDLAEMHPIELLDYAAKSIAEAGPIERQVRAGLYASGYFETSLLAKSMAWLVDRRGPEALLDPDTPAWLFDLDRGIIRAAKRRTEDESTSYLLEIKLPGGPVGSMQIRLDNKSGAITNYFAASGSIAELVKLLKALERQRGEPYRKVAPRTALKALTAARAAFDTNPILDGPANPWPHNRALLDFVLDEFEVS